MTTTASRIKKSFIALLVFPNSTSDGHTQGLSNALDGNAIEDVLEETGHDHLDRFFPCEAAAAGIKDQLFIDAAVEAVRQWAYSPTLLDGIPVPVIVTVTVNFELGD